MDLESHLQITLANVAVIAQTYTDLTGGACSIGEQPIKGLLDPNAMVRLAVGEALTNLVWTKVTSLSDVKASGNWMYAAKLDGEGATMYDVVVALSEAMIELAKLDFFGNLRTTHKLISGMPLEFDQIPLLNHHHLITALNKFTSK
ncbi:hypothetical protein H5410_008790 [Solanum commersonii]|uniref:FGAR-AT PurM N-terminal-like domain-containing protein n=1 Tax=Solanum commersonii TaxID=4109 RepID=A0A9J6AGY0_SOLCO|nr:hypothetical protein H5410_008790 [Solanum commersonii]